MTLCVWALFGDTNLKYMIYLLPPLLVMISVGVNRGVFDVDPRGLTALFLFAAIAGLSLANSPDFNFFAQRDLIIIGGYLLLFALPMRLVPTVVDGILACLICTVALEATAKGFSLQIDFLASEGIMESIMAFPLGAVLLYYIYNRSWTRALIAFFIFFATFKRIAFVGIALVIAIEMAVWITGQAAEPARALATLAAIGLMHSVALYDPDRRICRRDAGCQEHQCQCSIARPGGHRRADVGPHQFRGLPRLPGGLRAGRRRQRSFKASVNPPIRIMTG